MEHLRRETGSNGPRNAAADVGIETVVVGDVLRKLFLYVVDFSVIFCFSGFFLWTTMQSMPHLLNVEILNPVA